MFDSNEKIPRTTELRWKNADAAKAAEGTEDRYHIGSGADSDNDNSDRRDGVISDDEDDDDEVYYNAESDVESDELNDIDCDDGKNGVKRGWWEDEDTDIHDTNLYV